MAARRGRARLTATLVVLATFVLACGGATPSPTEPAGGGEIFLEAVADPGPDPFTESVASTPAPPAPTAEPTDPIPPSAGPPVVQSLTGGEVGLYGGSLNSAECDSQKLITLLEEVDAKAAAWSSAQGIGRSELRGFIEHLTAVTLLQDTRVTNHGYKDGVGSTPRQSVLQTGSTVMVDDRGVPRARCESGSPLKEPVPVTTTPKLVGTPWPGFKQDRLATITPAPKPLAKIPVVDKTTGTVFERGVGSTGGDDTPVAASPAPSAAATTEPVASAEPTSPPGPGTGEPVARAPLVPSDLTGLGAVEANSIDLNFPIQGAVDVDLTTSWFSKGPHTPTTVTTYEWSVSGPVEIGQVIVIGNGENATQAFRTGFGFASVTVEVLRGGVSVASMTGAMGGIDPRFYAEFPAGTIGDAVRLSFTGHESLDCGGIGELLVLDQDWRADQGTLGLLGYAD